MSTCRWTPDDETAYLEERKYICEHFQPEHEDTIRWLESVTTQDLIYAVYRRYGIHPATIYKEFEAENSLCNEDRIISGLIEDVA